ncbi:ABC transporter [Cordyceps fumosorosea ARSEF 2679]|uniref:ABC transporter n=1 Tax=Cordyceps fumosorosea (strain ARSEF 2679) TaxID=1081104 RepID=A0A162LJH0_CORFA|nr:ABC transporter [Cordyceps fumosorosea ARSEF 2679]OAA71404.1 ABC transporter [Cordyceps fumosorosea ARSEF 2679]
MAFLRQLTALMWKNLLVTVLRHPVGFLLQFYAVPLVVFAVLARLPVWLSPTEHTFSTELPAAIPSSPAITGTIAVVAPPNAGADIRAVIDRLAAAPDRPPLLRLDRETDLISRCGADDCHAAVVFRDSPGTTTAGSWNYTIRADASMTGAHGGGLETVYMPLQRAVNAAITNATTTSSPVEAFAFGPTWSQDADEVRRGTLSTVTEVYAFVLFGCHLVAVYAIAGWVSSDRDAGVSALLDSMGGRGRRWTLPLARTLSWVAVLDGACLPLFVTFGALYQRLLFPASGVGALIGWQVLLGTALNSSAVFAAAFFSRARVSAIVVGVFALALAVAFQFHASRPLPLPAPGTVLGLSAVFPSCNYMLYLLDMARWEVTGRAAHISSLPPARDSAGQTPDLYHVTQSTLLGILAVQAVVYLGLAVLVECLMHGIHFKGRHFKGTDSCSSPAAAAVSATNLQKTFRPGFWTRIFSCGSDRKRTNRAVDDVSIDAHRGQIMCLVGPNGSGKTTTLQMLGGFLGMDGGTGRVSFDAAPSRVGICPQHNVLWEELTVREHLVLWSGIKGNPATSERIDALIADCDLARKSGCPARHLSGGQRRKLQLACMLVGDPAVCLVDECTSGLDPLSRQAIWDLLLRSRAAGRSLVLTTHFLDEVDVLADHIVVLQGGRIRAQGSPAELSATHGGGHRVMVERTPESLAVDEELQEEKGVACQDRLVYRTKDSAAAAKLARSFAAAGVHDVAVAGPQFDNIFLNLAGDRGDSALPKPMTTTPESDEQRNHHPMEPGRETSFATQVRVLFRKRFQVLPRVWWAQLLAAAIVVAATCGLLTSTRDVVAPDCGEYAPRLVPGQTARLQYDEACARGERMSGCDTLTVGPASANATVFEALRRGYPDFDGVVAASGFVNALAGRGSWLEYMQKQTGYFEKGIYFGSGGAEDPVVIAYQYQAFISEPTAAKLLNIWSQATANIEIATTYGSLPRIPKDTQDGAWIFVLFIALVQAAYPAFFVVYPAIERRSNVSSLQYANGVRRTPQMVAYMLFDLLWIVVLSVVSTIAIVPILGWTGSPLLMILIFALHAVCGNFVAQIASHVSNGPLKAFLTALTVNLICFAIGFGTVFGSLSQPDKVIDGVAWGLGFFLPMANLVRALLVGFNAGGLGCTDGVAKMMGAMDAYGGPILYLVLQVVWLGILSVWVDGGLPNISLPGILTRSKPAAASPSSTELQDLAAAGQQGDHDDDVRAETTRALRTDTDPLRVLNVTKRFGANLAVDDVTFGLGPGEVLALLGPNGAGKSTLVNMIQSELRPTHGTILLGGGGAQAGRQLGVCPQHDGLDLLSTQQHLTLYARIKGVRLMDRLGLAPHARTPAARLSGGNKRKLSLAIALLGAPPVLVLDEPTTAMDALSKRAFWRLVEEFAGGHSVLLTTHSMEEADRLAGRTAIMAAGRLLAVGSTARLQRRHGGGHSVGLALRSAPDSSQEEMAAVWAWVRERAAAEGSEAKLERDMLRGQIRFTLSPAAADEKEEGEDGGAKGRRLPPAIALWTLLEENKDELGIAFYSIGGATLANAFMNVVRANNVCEENSEAKKRSIGQLIRDLF